MAEAYITELQFQDKEITAIICDQEEFDANIDILEDVICHDLTMMDAEQKIENIKRAGWIPLCHKTEDTAVLFEKYGVKTETLCMAVRGLTERIMNLK